MKAKNWTAVEIATKVASVAKRFGPENSQELENLRRALARANEDDLSAGLLAAFTDHSAQSCFATQQMAGTLLLDLRPRFQGAPEDFLSEALQSWDRSVEELPWYLAHVLGVAAVRAALEDIQGRLDAKLTGQAVQAFEFWLDQIPKSSNGGS